MKIHMAWTEWEGNPGVALPLCSPGFKAGRPTTFNVNEVDCRSCRNLVACPMCDEPWATHQKNPYICRDTSKVVGDCAAVEPSVTSATDISKKKET